MQQDKAVEVAEIFHLLGDPTRLRVVVSCLDDARAVGEIAGLVDVSPSLVSHHLRLLRAARLVRAERRGRGSPGGPLHDNRREQDVADRPPVSNRHERHDPGRRAPQGANEARLVRSAKGPLVQRFDRALLGGGFLTNSTLHRHFLPPQHI